MTTAPHINRIITITVTTNITKTTTDHSIRANLTTKAITPTSITIAIAMATAPATTTTITTGAAMGKARDGTRGREVEVKEDITSSTDTITISEDCA